MSDKKNSNFYLEEVYPDFKNLIGADYKPVSEIQRDCIFVLDTNILLFPFSTSEKNLQSLIDIFERLKEENRLLIPARVIREFVKNRANEIGKVFLKLRQTKNKMNSGDFKLDDYPLLQNEPIFGELKDTLSSIKEKIKEAREKFDQVESTIKDWNWNDPVSHKYKEIFTQEIFVEMQKDRKELTEDLESRIKYKIAPGYKDSSKIDDGIGDLIVWQTILEIGAEKKKNLIFVSNDQKNDWFYKQDKLGLYPRFELFDEYRRSSEGQSFNMINLLQFLEIFDANEEMIKEVEKEITQTQERYNERKLGTECSVENCHEIAVVEVLLYDKYSHSDEEFLERDFTCPYLCLDHQIENEKLARGEKRPRGVVRYPHSNRHVAQGYTKYRILGSSTIIDYELENE